MAKKSGASWLSVNKIFFIGVSIYVFLAIEIVIHNAHTAFLKSAASKLAGVDKYVEGQVLRQITSISTQGQSLPMTNCSKKVEFLPQDVIVMHDVILDPTKAVCRRRGGETIQNVQNQKESDEYCHFLKGFYRLSCDGTIAPKSINTRPKGGQKFINGIVNALDTNSVEPRTHLNANIKGLTVAIIRRDYANIYWTVIELHMAYLTVRKLGREANATHLLIMDAHPLGKLEGLWDMMFKDVYRVGWFQNYTRLESLVFAPFHMSPIVTKSKPIPYFDDFRISVVAASHGRPHRKINCKNLTVSLIVRKDYIAHPRNMQGKIKRKLLNAEEVMEALRGALGQHTVRSASLEDMSVEEQVRWTSSSDILIGVHGAGLAQTVFQPPGSGLIELFPLEYKRSPNPHMEQLAVWGGKTYAKWYSTKTQADSSLSVPPQILVQLVHNVTNKIC